MRWYDPIGISPNFKVDGSHIALLIRIDFHVKMAQVKFQPSIAIYRTKYSLYNILLQKVYNLPHF